MTHTHTMQEMHQTAPYPEALRAAVVGLESDRWPGWAFILDDQDRGQGCTGKTLIIRVTVHGRGEAPRRAIGSDHHVRPLQR